MREMPTLTTGAVREKAHDLGIDAIRFTHVRPLDGLAAALTSRISAGLLPEDLVRDEHHLRRRSQPARHLRGARSVVSAALGYFRDEPEDATETGAPHGRIARYTWCDYYGELRQRLRELARWMNEQLPGTRSVAYSNYTSLAEKPLAVRAGLGWQGKNSLVLNATLGSLAVLGDLVTQAEFEPDVPVGDGCGECDACVRACPTGALVAPAVLDTRRCIQHRGSSDGPIPADMRALWENRLYGCNTCQDVCPRNRKVPITRIRATRGCVGASVPLLPLFSMTDDEIRHRFAGNQMAKPWVRPQYLLRNAAVCLGNLGDPVGIPVLVDALSHRSPLVRGAAAWSLGQLGGNRAARALEQRLRSELDEAVILEIRGALACRPS